MKADEVVKGLRWIAKNDEIVFNAEMAKDAANLLEQLKGYSDTGLTVSEIMEYKKFEDNLVRVYKCDLKHVLALLEIDQLKASQPVRGEWEEDGIFQRCSKCHSNFATEDSDGDELIFDFCPNCGADMRGEENE